MSGEIDFQGIARAALARADTLVPTWLPGGKRKGHEWFALNPMRKDDHAGNFKVNLNTGKWGDFAMNGISGHDLISLYAYLNQLKQSTAAKHLTRELGIASLNGNAKRDKGDLKREPDISYEICNVAGEVVAIHHRFEARRGGSKEIKWQRPNGQWDLGGMRPAALPLYGAHLTPAWPDDSTAVVVEGEKCAERLWRLEVRALGTVCAAKVTPDDGQLRPLCRFASVILWPDNDEVGIAHMRSIAGRLLALGCAPGKLQWLNPDHIAGLSEKGADCADLDDDTVRDALTTTVGPIPIPDNKSNGSESSGCETQVTDHEEFVVIAPGVSAQLQYTDTWLAGRFILAHPDEFCFRQSICEWHRWTGEYWQSGMQGEVNRCITAINVRYSNSLKARAEIEKVKKDTEELVGRDPDSLLKMADRIASQSTVRSVEQLLRSMLADNPLDASKRPGRMAADIEERPIAWLWEGIFVQGGLPYSKATQI